MWSIYYVVASFLFLMQLHVIIFCNFDGITSPNISVCNLSSEIADDFRIKSVPILQQPLNITTKA